MTPEITIALISGTVAISIALISKTDFLSRKHYGLRKDLELHQLLPGDSTKKADLIKFIDKRIEEYIIKSTQHKRSPTEITIGFIFLPTGLYLSWFFLSLGSWWLFGLVISIFFLIIGIYGIVSGFRKVERDEKGNAVSRNKVS